MDEVTALLLDRSALSQPEPVAHLSFVGRRPCPDRNGDDPLAIPAGVYPPRDELLRGLRQRIRAVEHALLSPAKAAEEGNPWTLGVPEFDNELGPAGLDPCGVHEVKPFPPGEAGSASQEAAALGFALRLAVRRLRDPPLGAGLLWCWTSHRAAELGRPYGLGLEALGLDPAAIVFLEAARARDVLWSLEEGLKSGALGLVLGVLDHVDLSSARRLSLAAKSHRTPCLLLTAARRETTAATATRWRAGCFASGPHAFDPRAPGIARHAVTLEHCRHRAAAGESRALPLEWSHETHCFRLASPLADRAFEPARAGRGSP